MRATMHGRFHKMHGLGNDFVVVDARAQALPISAGRARAVADRRTGIGCDQLIVLEAAVDADATMRIWNADGSEVEACGNAARAVGLLLGSATLRTLGGTIAVDAGQAGITVDMGTPRFDWDEIPLAYALDTAALPVNWDALVDPVAVNVGNPHLVFFVDDLDAIPLDRIGPRIESDPLFPERINVNVARIDGPSRILLRTWERGAGLTRACGTGACATAIAALRSRRVSGPVEIVSVGGTLSIDWKAGGTVRMTGIAQHVFTGETDWDAFPL